MLRAPPMLLPPMRGFLLGRDWGGSPTVRYQAFLLGRFRLAVPQLAPLLPYRDYLVLMLANLDAKRSGAVSSRQFAAACRALHLHFGDAAALCAKPGEVLAAMGIGSGRSKEGSVAIRGVDRRGDGNRGEGIVRGVGICGVGSDAAAASARASAVALSVPSAVASSRVPPAPASCP